MGLESVPLMMEPDVLLRARLEALLADHGPGLRRVARTYSTSPTEAADLAQEIAVAIWRALPTFRGDCSDRTFAYRIAHNRGISYAESRSVRERTTPLVEASPVPDPRPNAEEAIHDQQRREALWVAIGTLPVGARAVLTLALEGMSHEEIAAVLGTSANSVTVRLSRARAELRKRLGKQS